MVSPSLRTYRGISGFSARRIGCEAAQICSTGTESLQAGEELLIRLQILRIVLLIQENIGKSDIQRCRAFRVLVKICLRKDPVNLNRVHRTTEHDG